MSRVGLEVGMIDRKNAKRITDPEEAVDRLVAQDGGKVPEQLKGGIRLGHFAVFEVIAGEEAGTVLVGLTLTGVRYARLITRMVNAATGKVAEHMVTSLFSEEAPDEPAL